MASEDELSRNEREEVQDDISHRLRGGLYVYTGYLTGEVTQYRDTEALYLTPVFVVTGGGRQR